MIHIGKSGGAVDTVAAQTKPALKAGLAEFERYEKEVGQWIKQNPLLGIGIALAVGVGMGWILKRLQ